MNVPTWMYLHRSILEESDQNNAIQEIFLDFAKALDCANHLILLAALVFDE